MTKPFKKLYNFIKISFEQVRKTVQLFGTFVIFILFEQTYFAPYEVPVEIVVLLSLFYGAISLVAVLGNQNFQLKLSCLRCIYTCHFRMCFPHCVVISK